MSAPVAENPFQASAHGARGGPPVPAAVWRAFAVRRGVRLLVLPTMLGLLTAVARQDLALPAWSIAVMTMGSAALWLPTSLWMTWARFLRPRDDDRGMLLTTGEVLDRRAFLHLVAARSVEVGLVLVAMWAMAALFFVTLGWLWALPVVLTCIVVSVWGALRLRTQVWTARAAVRLAGERFDRAGEAIRKALQIRTGRRTTDTLLALQASQALRIGRPEQARASLGALSNPTWMDMDVVAAILDLEDGVEVPSTLRESSPDSLVRALVLSRLRALDDLYAERPAAALSELETWSSARAWLPAPLVQQMDLLAAAAHACAGELGSARAALSRSRTVASQRAWIEVAHPRWHAWLLRADPEEQG